MTRTREHCTPLTADSGTSQYERYLAHIHREQRHRPIGHKVAPARVGAARGAANEHDSGYVDRTKRAAEGAYVDNPERELVGPVNVNGTRGALSKKACPRSI
jgi:hypothetical protein